MLLSKPRVETLFGQRHDMYERICCEYFQDKLASQNVCKTRTRPS